MNVNIVNIVDELQDQCANLEIDLVNAGNDIHRLTQALEMIAGIKQPADNTMSNKEIALEVLLEVFDTPSDPGGEVSHA